MIKYIKALWGVVVFMLMFSPGLFAQEDFGFGFADEEEQTAEALEGGLPPFAEGQTSSPQRTLPAVTIGGEVRAELLAYTDGFESFDKFEKADLGDVFSGKLKFSASGKRADAVINLNLKPVFNGSESPVLIDEAYVRGYFGPVDVEGGIRKLTWGRADSFGPLDVVNPLDYRNLTDISNIMKLKIGRPMVHVTWAMGNFSKIEGVFVPWFEGHKFSLHGRWAPEQVKSLDIASYLSNFGVNPANIQIPGLSDIISYSDTHTLKYAQGGLRFTQNMGAWDFGVQYYFGRLPRPAYTATYDIQQIMAGISQGKIPAEAININVDYNYYHQIGVDYAQVLWGFNTRAEAAIHLTEDMAGDKGNIYNPFAAWSLGFDRDIVWEINGNIQVTETVRLFQSRVGGDPLTDIEAGKTVSSTRITAILSKTFFRDALKLKVTGLWGIEDKDFLIIPAIIWTKDDLSVELAAGIFGGDSKGELGQYSSNSYLKAVMTYQF